MKLAGYDVPDHEIELIGTLAGGPGGQNVNKVSSAIHLRFDIAASSLPDHCKERLLALQDTRLSSEGVIVIKAQRYRSRELNRRDALQRLDDLVTGALHRKKARKPTRPTVASQKKRVEEKKARGKVKKLRSDTGME